MAAGPSKNWTLPNTLQTTANSIYNGQNSVKISPFSVKLVVAIFSMANAHTAIHRLFQVFCREICRKISQKIMVLRRSVFVFQYLSAAAV